MRLCRAHGTLLAWLVGARGSARRAASGCRRGAPKNNFRYLCGYAELMEHSSHGLSERVVVRVERRRVVGAAAWFEVLGGSEQWFNGLVSENNQGGYRLEACRPGLIATCRADALHDLLAAELLQVVSCPRGTILCECLLAERTDACR